MFKKKLFVYLPALLIASATLSGCGKQDGIRVIHVLNSEDYIYEVEQNGYYCDECEDYVDDKYVVSKIVDGEKVYSHKVTHEVIFNEEENSYFCESCEEEIPEEEVVSKNGKYFHDVEHEVYYDESMIDQFSRYWEETTGEKIKVVYDTYDTNETMFNELNTGKSNYDVICTSDYMIQKLITHNMLHEFNNYETTTEDGIWGNISTELSDRFLNIKALPKDKEEEVSIYDYSVPYMWGTIGIMYNPNYYMDLRGIETDEESPKFNQEAYDEALESIKNDFKSWDVLYDKDSSKGYSGSFSIKDSVRDTYAVSLVHTFKDEIANIEYDSRVTSISDENEKNAKINELLTDIFNRHDPETISKVEKDMNKLKENAFGFETDSGKTDMVDEKVGANMCWSGDATWAIWVAEDPSLEERDDGKEVDPLNLYFSIPTGHENEEASNIWFDALAMCENKDSDIHQYEIAQAFIEFMCQPENAVQNCDAVGYTPGTAGYDVLEYMYETFDVRGEIGGELPEGFIEGEDYIKYDLTYFYGDENTTGGEDPDAVLYADPIYIDRQLTAQYPLESDLVRLAVMDNFPEKDTANLLSMWERVRTNKLPLWATIVFIVEGVGAITFVAYFVVKKATRKKLKGKRTNF